MAKWATEPKVILNTGEIVELIYRGPYTDELGKVHNVIVYEASDGSICVATPGIIARV